MFLFTTTEANRHFSYWWYKKKRGTDSCFVQTVISGWTDFCCMAFTICNRFAFCALFYFENRTRKCDLLKHVCLDDDRKTPLVGVSSAHGLNEPCSRAFLSLVTDSDQTETASSSPPPLLLFLCSSCTLFNHSFSLSCSLPPSVRMRLLDTCSGAHQSTWTSPCLHLLGGARGCRARSGDSD